MAEVANHWNEAIYQKQSQCQENNHSSHIIIDVHIKNHSSNWFIVGRTFYLTWLEQLHKSEFNVHMFYVNIASL